MVLSKINCKKKRLQVFLKSFYVCNINLSNVFNVFSQLFVGMFGADEPLNEDGEVIHDDHYGIPVSWTGYDHESGVIKYLLAVGTGGSTLHVLCRCILN